MDNIKEYVVNYKPNRIPIVSGLEQWDYGQYLVIKDIPLDLLEDEKEIHFCFPNSLKSVVVKAEYEDDVLKAKIPKFIFQKQIESCLYSSYKAYAFVYLKTNEYGKTIYKIALEIEARPKPDDYEYEEEQLYFEELIEVLDAKADNIKYSGNILYLLSGEHVLSRVTIKSGSGGGTGTGTDGREIELRNNGTYIQWRYVGDEIWINLVSLETLKGENGITPNIGENGNWFIGEEDTNIKAQGTDGRGIKSIEKTATNENVDTYTITFTDNEKFEYTVTNAVQSSGESFSGKAEDVSYDDEKTQLGATNVQGAISQLSATIGDLEDLQTTEKENIIKAVNEVFQSASNGKKLIASTITGKGVPTSETDTFQTMATNISNISGAENPLTKCGYEKFKFAVFADTHIKADETANANNILKNMIANVQDSGCEFIAIVGDVCDSADAYDQYKNIKENNATIPIYEVAGNHDATSSGINTELWKDCTGKDPYYEIVHDDDVFIFASQARWSDDANSALFPQSYQEWTTSKLEEHKSKSRVFFFFHQYVSGNEGFGDRYGTINHSYLTGSLPFFENLINEYKNVIWFNGHSHTNFALQANYPNVLAYNKNGAICTLISTPSLQSSEYYEVIVYDHLVEIIGYNNGSVVDSIRYMIDDYVYVSPVQSVTLDKTTLNFANEDVQTIQATVIPSNYLDQLIWYSSNDEVATVADGVVSPVSNGSCIITAKCDDKYATCEVNVDMVEGEVYYSITSTLNGCTLSNTATKVKDKSSYASILNVPDNLSVNSVIVIMGGTDVTSTVYNSSSKTIEISEVTGNLEIVVSVNKLVTGLSLDTTSITLKSTGATHQLTATKTPSDAVGDITWESSDPTVATVLDGLITITATSSGTCTITAKCNGITATCEVKVEISQRTVVYRIPEVTATFNAKGTSASMTGGTDVVFTQPLQQGIKYYATCESFKYADGTDVNSPVDKIYVLGDAYLADGTLYKRRILGDYVDLIGKDAELTTGFHPLTYEVEIAIIKNLCLKASSSSPVTFPVTVTMKGFEIVTYGETI